MRMAYKHFDLKLHQVFFTLNDKTINEDDTLESLQVTENDRTIAMIRHKGNLTLEDIVAQLR